MKNHYYYLLSAMLLVSACNGDKKQTGKENSIDLEKAITGLTELKASDFGKTIRYIPLETTDESLIADLPSIRIVKDKIIVITVNQCMAFDKTTGKFITSIGHRGNDPDGYYNSYGWIDEENDMIYFLRRPNQLMGFDTNGNFKGKIEIQAQKMPGYFLFTGEHIIGAYNNEMEYGQHALAIFNRNGEMLDSIPNSLTDLGQIMNDIVSINVFRTTPLYGNWGQNGLMNMNFSNDKAMITSPHSEVLWKNNGNVYYKELFNDTVYTLKDNATVPYLTFNTGNLYWPQTERTSAENNNRRLVVTYVNETDNSIFFQCIQGLYADKVIYNGLYNKETGITKLAGYDKMIDDDIHSFMPFQIRTTNSKDEYAGFIEVPDALEWLEENPEASENPELAFLKELTDDMNPIVVLVK